MREYYDLDHAKMRLQGCVVSMDDKYVHINQVDGSKSKGFRIVYSRLSKDQERMPRGESVTSLDYCDIRTDNLRLGFVNSKGGALYLMRDPVRQWKEGLTQDNVSHINPYDDSRYINNGPSNKWGGKYLLPTLNGEYPSFEQACEDARLRRRNYSWIAFDRDLAVNRDGAINFKGYHSIGIERDGKIILAEPYEYLKESLEEMGLV